jgi:hypothetical protein
MPTDSRLTHRIVTFGGYWGKGPTLKQAQGEYRRQAGRKAPAEAVVYAVTPDTRVDEMGRFTMPANAFVQPQCINGEAD